MAMRVLRCAKCGYENPVEAKFCMNCGASLEGAEVITKETVAVKKPVLFTIKEPEKSVLITLFFISAIILICDILLNSVVQILTRLIIIGAPYVIGLILSIYTGYIIKKKAALSSIDRILAFLAIILSLLGTLSIYVMNILAGSIMYSPIWLLYVVILFITFKALK